MGRLRAYLNANGLNEEDVGTGSSDIATFTSKLDMVKRNKYLEKGKKCKKHGKLNCKECCDDYEDSKWK